MIKEMYKVNDYINKSWQPILAANHLDTFEKLWAIEADWFEPPNKRRGGWSGVSRIVLNGPNEPVVLFLKRQENHKYRPLRNIVKGAPTFRREMRNIKRFLVHGIPIPEAVYYGERKVGKKSRAILITASIAPAYQSLDYWLEHWQQEGFPPEQEYKKILTAIAKAVSFVHKKRFKYGSMVSKHIFLQYTPGTTPHVRFIDLEKARYWFLPINAALSDLNALLKSVQQWVKDSDLRYFFRQYDRFTSKQTGRRLFRKLLKKDQQRKLTKKEKK